MTATLKTRRTDEHAANATAHFAAAFESAKSARENDALWLRNLREEAMAQVREIGLPKARDEEWRFLDLRPLYELDAQPNASTREYSQDDESLLSDYLFDGFDGHRLVFINGEYSQKLSQIQELPEGATLGSLRDHLARDSELVPGKSGALRRRLSRHRRHGVHQTQHRVFQRRRVFAFAERLRNRAADSPAVFHRRE